MVLRVESFEELIVSCVRFSIILKYQNFVICFYWKASSVKKYYSALRTIQSDKRKIYVEEIKIQVTLYVRTNRRFHSFHTALFTNSFWDIQNCKNCTSVRTYVSIYLVAKQKFVLVPVPIIVRIYVRWYVTKFQSYLPIAVLMNIRSCICNITI